MPKRLLSNDFIHPNTYKNAIIPPVKPDSNDAVCGIGNGMSGTRTIFGIESKTVK